jgi:hypothetical protein
MNIVNCAQHDLAIDNYCDLFSLSLSMILTHGYIRSVLYVGKPNFSISLEQKFL